MMVMQIPIKSCALCYEAYDLEEWATMPLVRMESQPCDHNTPCPKGAHVVEVRACIGTGDDGRRCGAELRLDVSDVETLDLEVSVAEYLELHPGTTRHLRRAYERTEEPPPVTPLRLAAAVLLLVAVVAAVVGTALALVRGAS